MTKLNGFYNDSKLKFIQKLHDIKKNIASKTVRHFGLF